ncbi:hypothetical protein CYR55_08475 [Chimaeribacter californicus]|uniref:Uncharacterized protein n=2 Tax=Chimaeribacter californicus TaxID=2060067 RepID=A0A2N5EA41_9GAMM|nr:hypothetical protein CYR55_08475 [Chimaeribacter californicus]
MKIVIILRFLSFMPGVFEALRKILVGRKGVIKTRMNGWLVYIIRFYILIYIKIVSLIAIACHVIARGSRERMGRGMSVDKISLPFRMLFVYTVMNMKKRAGYYEFL